jgi:predicted alpha/beta-fold hydrolase
MRARNTSARPGGFPAEEGGFSPAWWLRGANIQTIAGHLLRSRATCPYRRERIELPDGDFLDLDFALPAANETEARHDSTTGIPPARPFVLLLHGLEGSSSSGYMLQAARSLAARNVVAVALNFRSCSGELNRLPRSYHSGETGDLAFVLRKLEGRFPDAPYGIIGFSIGGNVLLKFLGERAADPPVRLEAAAAVSVPFDLSASARRLEAGLGRLYGLYFLRSLRAKAQAKARLFPEDIEVSAVRRSTTLREFDEAVTAPLHGFDGADDYYRRCSSAGFLRDVGVPTLLVQSADDPFLPEGSLPSRDVAQNQHLVPAFTSRGGHVGYVAGKPPLRHLFWAESEAVRFVVSALRKSRGLALGHTGDRGE